MAIRWQTVISDVKDKNTRRRMRAARKRVEKKRAARAASDIRAWWSNKDWLPKTILKGK